MEQRNGKYREMIYVNGKALKSPFFRRKTDANEWKRNQLQIRDKIRASGDDYIDVTRTFVEHAKYWLESSIKHSKAKSTYSNYEMVFRIHLEPLLRNTALTEIRVSHAEKLLTKLSNEGKKPKGINDILMVFKAIMNDAEKRGYLFKNHLKSFSLVKVPQQSFKYWSEQEINKFFLGLKGRSEFYFYSTAIYTGMRRGEIAGLCWDCIDFHKKVVTVKRTLDRYGLRDSTKTGLIKHIPINDFLLRILGHLYSSRSTNSKFVFTDASGNPLNPHHLYRSFRKLQEEFGIDNILTVHDLRHTFASQFMMKGGNLYDLSKLLGHTEVKMTQRYAHLSPDHLAGATQRISFGLENESYEFNPILTPNTFCPEILESNESQVGS